MEVGGTSYRLGDVGNLLSTVCSVGVIGIHRNDEMGELSADEGAERVYPKQYWQKSKNTHG